MRLTLITTAVLVPLILSGCVDTIKVSRTYKQGDKTVTDTLPGLPFNKKYPVLTQKSVRDKHFYQVTFAYVDNKTENTIVLEKFIDAGTSAGLNKLERLEELGATIEKDKPVDSQVFNNYKNTFDKITEGATFNSINAECIENSITTEWKVDPNSQYYINSPLPWFGSNEFSAELNDDGTLKTVKASPDTNASAIVDTVAGMIPLSDYLTAKYVTPLTKAFTETVTYQLTLKIKEGGYRYTYTKPMTDENATLGDCLNAGPGISFSRTSLTSSKTDAATENSASATSSKSITINGTIQLPN